MDDLQSLIEQKQKLGSISTAMALGLPIFLSLSRMFREWATWAATPYRALTPIYVFGLLFVFFKYRKTLHEIIVLKLTKKMAPLEKDEQATLNELTLRQNRIRTIPWFSRNSWLFVGIVASAGVDAFLWTLAVHIDKPPIMAALFAVFAITVLGIYYWRREYFTRREKVILGLIESR